MTREELIEHLEHLEKYTHYSEDVPALREAIALLKTHKERTETHACDLIKRQDAIDAVNSIDNLDAKARGGICFKLMGLPPAQPEVRTQMSSADCISRQAAIKALHDEIVRRRINEDSNDDGALDEFDTEAILRRLPPAQPEQRWISCSERLPDHPENNDYYLVTIQCEHHDGWDDYVTGFAEWTKYGWDELSYYIGQIKVIAWMSLPEPYKERREK